MKTVYSYDLHGYYTQALVLDDSDLSPLEEGVYLIPANAIEAAPPSPSGDRWPRLIGGTWQLADRETGETSAMDDVAALRQDLRLALNVEYEQRMQTIASGYPPSERESWPVQTGEARALLADPEADTPWIDAAGAARGVDRVELAQRIVAKDAMYRVVSGFLSGVRQRIEDQIDAAADDVAALRTVDVTIGWPDASLAIGAAPV